MPILLTLFFVSIGAHHLSISCKLIRPCETWNKFSHDFINNFCMVCKNGAIVKQKRNYLF